MRNDLTRNDFTRNDITRNDWMSLADRSLEAGGISRDDARLALAAPEDEAYELLAAARRVRVAKHGNRVRVHVLMNAKQGACPEDCSFCSQSSRFDDSGRRTKLETVESIVAAARHAADNGAWKFCIVTATRGPSDADLDRICAAVREIKRTIPVKVCTSLGLLDDAKAARLAAAGVDRFNHNLETSERIYPTICTTHTWRDRVETVRTARRAGMEICSGGIVGMGETDEDLLDLAFALREVEASSIPVNFLDPRPGTPLGGTGISIRRRLTPLRCLQVLAVFRLIHPAADLRAAGGREMNLRSLQPLCLLAANSIFTEGYLTTPGNRADQDRRMIEDAGFTMEQVAAAPDHVAV
ncbi:MAG: Biotin synthase [Planctomycetes bacterium]|nr:Biotin synthase [Planctomycetota bacterium]